MALTYDEILDRLRAGRDADAVAGMARYGIVGAEVFGVKVPILRSLAKEAGRDHDLALRLWAYTSRETRVLATMGDRPQWVDEAQMETCAADFDSLEVGDQACGNRVAHNPGD